MPENKALENYLQRESNDKIESIQLLSFLINPITNILFFGYFYQNLEFFGLMNVGLLILGRFTIPISFTDGSSLDIFFRGIGRSDIMGELEVK